MQTNQEKSQEKGRQKSHYDHAVFTWDAPEYTHYKKTPLWFGFFMLITGMLAAYALVKEDYIFATVIVLFALAYPIIQKNQPKKIKISLSRYGIKMGEQTVPFRKIKKFWIIYDPPFVKTLNFRTEGRFMPDFSIEFQDQDPADLREFLARYIPEWEEKDEPVHEILIRLLRL